MFYVFFIYANRWEFDKLLMNRAMCAVLRSIDDNLCQTMKVEERK